MGASGAKGGRKEKSGLLAELETFDVSALDQVEFDSGSGVALTGGFLRILPLNGMSCSVWVWFDDEFDHESP